MKLSHDIRTLLESPLLIDNFMSAYQHVEEEIDFNKIVEICNNQISRIISNGSFLGIESTILFENLLTRGLLIEEGIIHYNYVIREVLLGRNYFRPTFTKEVFRRFTEAYAKTLTMNFCTCEITDLDDVFADEDYGHIRLNEKKLDEFLVRDPAYILYVIFHEISHVEDDREMENLIDYRNLRFAKDIILRKINKDYYQDNYERLSYETYADLRSFKRLKAYIESLGIIYEQERFNLTAKQSAYNHFCDERRLDGDLVDVDELVYSYLKLKPETIKYYPSLTLEYRETASGITRRTDEEITRVMENLNASIRPLYAYKEMCGACSIDDIYDKEGAPMQREDFYRIIRRIHDYQCILDYRARNEKIRVRKRT